MMKTSTHSRTAAAGFALPVTLFALILLGTLISGVFFTAMLEARVGRNQAMRERAFQAAEFGLNATLAGWKSGTLSALPTGGVATFVWDSLGWSDTVKVTKLGPTTYQLVSTAVVGRGTSGYAQHRTGMAVRLVYPTFVFRAALMTRGSTTIGGNSLINGSDNSPAGWPCPPVGAAKPGIVIPRRSDVNSAGCTAWRCIDGNPDISPSSAASDTANYFVYGDLSWASLVSMASVVSSGGTLNGLAPSTVNGVCRTTDPKNWGDPGRSTPAGVCESYVPIIYVNGNARLTQGMGQGILLVNGDLEFAGNFQFSGPVIVRGTFTSTGTGNKVRGGVMAGNAAVSTNAVLGDAQISYSSCVLQTIAMAAGSPAPTVQRAWVDMF